MSNAWEVTVDDVATVLGRMGLDESEAEEVCDRIDCGDVENAALQSTDFDE